ncbi:MAG: HD-GYP domain-containing protein [Sulfurimicrobium sp.]
MADSQTFLIEVSRLRVGMYVHLDLGWMDHPFSLSSFKISSQAQIDTIRSLGIERIRYSPDKSDPAPVAPGAAEHPQSANSAATAAELPDMAARNQRRERLARQHASLQVCERQFARAALTYRQVMESVYTRPGVSREQSESIIKGFVGEILEAQDACIRLLSEKGGEKSSLHSVNVTIISLLLGKASGLGEVDLLDLGMGALLHDIGKIGLPDRLRWYDEHFVAAERQIYQEHVAHGVDLARKMRLSNGATLVIGQHHEHADGSGFPQHIDAERMSLPARIVSLVNHYDNLCNPGNPARAVTPHEALAFLFAQKKSLFHGATLSLFVRMMGVYPPGSVVQLTDERFALVVSVNSTRPLKPSVVVHDPHVPPDEALVIDLEDEPGIGIRRSLKPLQLTKAAYDYLSPRKRMCYFFERAREIAAEDGGQ